jgi:EmrB/QacA subfamily drug resistance transporter
MTVSEKTIRWVIAGLLLGILMSAMDNTIVATAMGTIVADLGGMDKFIWVTSAYMVAVMAGMPIFGKLSDMYGRKRFYILGLVVFLIGSALCGIAQNIVQLSLYRAIQGIGGGALMPIAFTIVFDIFPPEKRGKMTGLFGAVFGISSVMGPLLGAYITEYISWHWVFYVNVPIGLVSLLLISKYYKESSVHKEQRIDWAGAISLVGAVVCLMFALELGGKELAWSSTPIIGLLSSFAVLFVLFLFVETRASDPIISFWMFKRRLFATSQVIAFLYGSTFVVFTIYIPIFVQAVYGGSATNAGLILTPMMLGSVVGSAIGGIFQTRTSFRRLMLISIVAYTAGIALLASIDPSTARWLLTANMIVLGFGVGFSFSLLPTASIHNMDPRHRGSANSTNAFFRSLGMTIGITVFGTLQSKTFAEDIKNAFADAVGSSGPAGIVLNDPRELFETGARAQIPAPVLDKIVAVMSSSITQAFLWALVPTVIAFVVILLMGDERVVPRQKPELEVLASSD